MAGSDRTGKNAGPAPDAPEARQDDLARRGRALDAALAARKPTPDESGEGADGNGMAGLGQALKLSSEFIAGVAVGAMLGWLVDRVAGTSPWGLIILLLLGFAAGVLNVLRSVGMVAEAKTATARDRAGGPDGK